MSKAAATPFDRGEWLTVREAAAEFGYNQEYVRQLARDGAIEAQKLGTSLLINHGSLLDYRAGMSGQPSRRGTQARVPEPPPRLQTISPTRPQPAAPPPVPPEPAPAADPLTYPGMIDDEALRARNQAAILLLERLSAPTADEATAQRETLTYLVKALDRERADSRKLFASPARPPKKP